MSAQLSDPEKFAAADAPKTAFKRTATKFHNRIGDAAYPAEAGRYRLYLSYACPWAHRCAVVRALKGLEDVIAVTWTHWELDHLSFTPPFDAYRGWKFEADEPHGFDYLDQLYELASPGYRAAFESARPSYTVPLLFDEKTQTFVSSESAEIIKMFNSQFNTFATRPTLDLAPAALAGAMEAVDAVVYPGINDGVYRCGFAQDQAAYDAAYDAHWLAMDKTEARLGQTRFLCGDTQITLSDIRLFTTLVRYDLVYYGHFKTSRNRLRDLPNLHRFLRDLARLPGLKETINVDHIKNHYYWSHTMVNPTRVIPKGPIVDLFDEAGLPPMLELV